MLQDIRDNSKGVVAKMIIGLIVAVFSLFGVQSIIGGFVTSPPVAEVNGEEINEVQLQNAAQSLLASIGATADSIDQSLVEQIALNQLIEETALRQSAQSGSMSISSDRIDRAIIETSNFQLNGQFDSDLAVRTMVSQGLTVPLYRESLRNQMLLAQVANAYSSSNFVTEAELENNAELSGQTRDFRYLSITLGTRTLGTAISDEELQTYYDANQEEFVEEETAVVDYVLLDKDVIAEEIEVDEADLLAQYEEERSGFEGSAEKRASHILLEVGADLSEEEAVELAETAQQRIAAGEEFSALALELSSDVGSAEQGGDIGYTDGSAFPEEIETALEVLTLDEVSDPIVTEFGVHLVKLTEDSENVFQAFEDVSARIERDLKSAQVELLYFERLEDLSNLAFESGDLSSISEELGLSILRSEAFGRNGGIGIFSNQNVVDAAFSDDVMLENNNSEVIELNTSQSAVLRIQQYNESSYRPLEDVQPEIAVLLRTEMERAAVASLGDELLTTLESGESADELLLASELEWISEEAVSRSAFSVNRQILDQVFSMLESDAEPSRTSLTLDNGTFIVAELNGINVGSLETLAEGELDQMTTAILTDLGNSDFQAFLLNLRENADIQQSNRLLEEEF